MTVKRYYCTTNETFEELAFKLKLETHLVRFGPFNTMKKDFHGFKKPWVGEIEERGEYFKLFRTKLDEHTSDLSVHGRCMVRSGKAMIAVEHKIHFTAIIGFLGLALFILTAFYLMTTKGIVVHPAWRGITCILALSIYGYSFYKDLREDEKLIRRLIYAKFVVGDEEDEFSEE